jgi:two-component system chemotaxis response regulator CheB
VVSALSENVFDALKAGAVDFISKPDVRTPEALQSFINEFIVKLKIASMAKVGNLKKASVATVSKPSSMGSERGKVRNLVAIGASTGGTEAIFDVIKAFDRQGPPIVIVQHMPPVFTAMYAKRLNQTCQMEVREACDGDLVKQGLVLIAPGDRHMKVMRAGSGYLVKLFEGEKVSGHCPSVDVLFESVAKVAGGDAVGVILTGMGRDGAKGLMSMREVGAFTLGQDEESCVVYGMPMVAWNIGAVCRQAPLDRIPDWINQGIGK